jgi:MFS transporter, putative metabolite:H+ symporter
MSVTIDIPSRRRSALAFAIGCGAVAAGVLAHLPMLYMGRTDHYHLAGMPMTAGMLWGMAAIVLGLALAAYGLLPGRRTDPSADIEEIAPPEDAPLTSRHWSVAGLLALALVIDIMKPASLGFVTPGMRAEYAIGDATVAWLPFAALAGTVAGSFLWGALADLYGRRAAILLSSVMFIGTSICGAMPSFWWNVAMCFLMGAAAGGMLPVAYALLAEIMPTRHRGWMLVLIGGLGATGGFLAASGFSAVLQPTFGWRIMWLLNLPTGLLLVVMSPLLPESARFLQQMGRAAEARAMLARFGIATAPRGDSLSSEDRRPAHMRGRAVDRQCEPPRRLAGVTMTLTLVALSWSAVNFGVLLWLPGALVADGRSVAAASALIARSTLIAAPLALVAAWLYGTWSTKGSLLAMLGLTACGLLGLALSLGHRGFPGGLTAAVTLLIVGCGGIISILLPYTAEHYPLRVRGRATGWIAGCSKLGGLIAQGLSVAGAAPPLAAAAATIGLPTLAAMALVSRYGRETRMRDLRELEAREIGRSERSADALESEGSGV